MSKHSKTESKKEKKDKEIKKEEKKINKKDKKMKSKHPKLKAFIRIVLIILVLLIVAAAAGVYAIFKTDKWAITKEELLSDAGATVYNQDGSIEIVRLTGDEINKKVELSQMGKNSRCIYFNRG